VVDAGAGLTDALADTLTLYVTRGRVKELILERAAARVDNQYVHWNILLFRKI
jgi:hypothetical protein